MPENWKADHTSLLTMQVSLSASLRAASQAALAPARSLEAARVSVRTFSLEPSAKVIPSPCEFNSMWSSFRLFIQLHSAGKAAVVGPARRGYLHAWQVGLSSVVNFG